jgi:hypothetical protein
MPGMGPRPREYLGEHSSQGLQPDKTSGETQIVLAL